MKFRGQTPTTRLARDLRESWNMFVCGLLNEPISSDLVDLELVELASSSSIAVCLLCFSSVNYINDFCVVWQSIMITAISRQILPNFQPRCFTPLSTSKPSFSRSRLGFELFFPFCVVIFP